MSDMGAEDEKQYLRRLLRQTVVGLGTLLCAAVLLGLFLRDPVTRIADAVFAAFGTAGVFVGVFASDAFGVPVPPSTYVFAAVIAESPMTLILVVAIATSIFGASIAYLIGPYMGKLPLLRTPLERFRPRAEKLFERWGIWTVGIAALTPLPFALICWLAGIYRMRYLQFLTTTFVRAPRILVYYGLFVVGWTNTGI